VNQPLRILTVAPLSWRHGHEWALQGVAMLRERVPALEYTIAGSGPALEAVAFARHQLGLTGCVNLLPRPRWLGRLPALRTANVYLCAAVAPVESAVPAEALRRDIHLICTDVAAGSVPVSAKHSLSVVPRWDAAAIAAAIESMAIRDRA
jgi:glycosyltransferase involved in cell wall biosynthesis